MSSRWSFGPSLAWGLIETTTFGKTHISLLRMDKTKWKIRILFEKYLKKNISVIVISVIVFFAIVAVIIASVAIHLKVQQKCELEGCNNGCLMVPERTYCYRGIRTDCFNRTCINEDDWTDYAGLTYTHFSGK